MISEISGFSDISEILPLPIPLIIVSLISVLLVT